MLDNMTEIIFIGVVLFMALLLSSYSVSRWKGNKQKVTLGYVLLSLGISSLLLVIFGCTFETIRGMIFALILMVASYSDIKERICNDYIHLMIAITAFIGVEFARLPEMVLSFVFVTILMVISFRISNKKIGGADVKLCMASSLVLGLTNCLSGMVLGLALAIIFNARKKDGFPLIPYLATGFMVAYFI